MKTLHRNFFLLGLLFAITAFDTLLLGFAIPKLIDNYNLSKSQAGLLGTTLMVGVGVGALILGALSDVFGRKRVIVLSVVVFSTFTGLLCIANNFYAIALTIFFSGFGLGGGLTMSIAYLPEIVWESQLNKYMCYFESFWGLGAVTIVVTSRLLLEKSLKELFLVGLFPIVFLPLFFKLPDIRSEGNVSLKGNVRELISKYRGVTAILWTIWFCGVYTYYGIFLWLPEVMRSVVGYEVGYSILIPIYGIQIASPLFLSLIVREENTEKLLFAYSMIAALTTFVSVLLRNPFALALGMLVTSFFSIGGWVLFILTTQKSYPQKIRGIGVGSAASVGRIGGIAAPYVTGYLMDLYNDIIVPFSLISAMFVIIAVLSLPLSKLKGSTIFARKYI